MFYSYPVQRIHRFMLTLNYVDMSCLFVIGYIYLDFLMLRTPFF